MRREKRRIRYIVDYFNTIEGLSKGLFKEKGSKFLAFAFAVGIVAHEMLAPEQEFSDDCKMKIKFGTKNKGKLLERVQLIELKELC